MGAQISWPPAPQPHFPIYALLPTPIHFIHWGPDQLESLIKLSPKQLVQLRVLYISPNLVEWDLQTPRL